MPNGRNAGRLYSDCENIHGYGQSHAFPGDPKVGDEVECQNCHRHFVIEGGRLVPLEWERYDELVDGLSEEDAKTALKREARMRHERSEDVIERRLALEEIHRAWKAVNLSTREGVGDFIGVMARHQQLGVLP